MVNRILKKWQPLQHYFVLTEYENNSDLAINISDNLNNENHVYFHFLSYILKLTNNLNKEFQSETPKIYKLLPIVKTFFVTILHNFIDKNMIHTNNLNELNFEGDIYKKDKDIYIGPKAEMALKNLSIHQIINIKENCKKYYIQL